LLLLLSVVVVVAAAAAAAGVCCCCCCCLLLLFVVLFSYPKTINSLLNVKEILYCIIISHLMLYFRIHLILL